MRAFVRACMCAYVWSECICVGAPVCICMRSWGHKTSGYRTGVRTYVCFTGVRDIPCLAVTGTSSICDFTRCVVLASSTIFHAVDPVSSVFTVYRNSIYLICVLLKDQSNTCFCQYEHPLKQLINKFTMYFIFTHTFRLCFENNFPNFLFVH